MSTVLTFGGNAAPTAAQALLTYVVRRLEVQGQPVTSGRAITHDLGRASTTAADPVGAVLTLSGPQAARDVWQGLDGLLEHERPGATLLLQTTEAAADTADAVLRHPALSQSHVIRAKTVAPQQIRLFPDGGFVLGPDTATDLQGSVAEFLAATRPVSSDSSHSAINRDPVPIVARRVPDGAPELADLLADLRVEYSTRYGRDTPNTTLTEVPGSDFVPPHGTFVVLLRGERTIAGGAIRRYDDQTAEIKRVWTSSDYRQQGLGRRVIDELELAASDLGYSRIYLTTGPRQPEAKALYLAAGYAPGFDTNAPSERIGKHAFTKSLDARRHGAA